MTTAIDHDAARRLLSQMVLIRRFEERCVELYGQGKIRGFMHLYDGEEAIAVGVSHHLKDGDGVVATYREHGQALARGVPATEIMAEMFGKVEGSSRGRGGSMHIFDAKRSFYGGNAIVAGGIPVAVGLALADQQLKRDRVTVCFFGEGAVAEGEFHEALNLAALWRVPIVFVCENNLYAMGSALHVDEADTQIAHKARNYAMAAETVDGMDLVSVLEASARAVAIARKGAPVFLEMRTYRFRAHSMFDAQGYRTKEEVEQWKRRDPIPLFLGKMKETGALSDQDLVDAEQGARKVIDEAVAFADAGTLEPVADLLTHVVADAFEGAPRGEEAMKTTYRECCKAAIRQALTEVPHAFLMGEDVGAYGGCYAVTKGLAAELGPDKIRDTPLSESGFVGAGIGAALGGMRPIVEVMTCNFALLALDQIVNNAATLRHMSGGQLGVPLVIRMATGAGRQLAAQHSHSFEGWFAHIPGLRILVPATLADARGMLVSAMREHDPVLIFEHVGLYNMEGEIDDATFASARADIERAQVRRRGKHLTVLSSGASLFKSLEAAEVLAQEGIEAEVVDLRVLRPLDNDTILSSVRGTHRVLVVDEGYKSGGLSAELFARVVEGAFDDLDAPPARVCSAEVPIPYAKHLEDAALPQVATIAAAARKVMGRG